MNTYLISYDLKAPGRDYAPVIEHIKSYTFWAKPLESLWLVKTSNTASEVRNALKGLIDANDKIFVIDVTGSNWATFNISAPVTDWMKENI